MSSEAEGRRILLACATLAIWVLCAVAGTVGLFVSYPRPPAALLELHTELVQVDLPKDPAPPPPPKPLPSPEPQPATPDAAPPTPAALPPLALPDAPAVTPVAAPSAAIAFAVPVEGLTRIVDVSQAAHGGPMNGTTTLAGGGTGGAAPPPTPAPAIIAPAIAAPPAVAHLTLGVGEGRQPPPEYPREALLARQEGNVVLRFQVDETGRVASIQVITPSRWPLLNQAATRAVHDTWHFSPGPVRIFEVPIQFQLARN